MNFDLTPEDRDLRDLCRDLAEREIAPYVDEWMSIGETPVELFKKMASLDLMGLCVPPEYGGIGASTVALVAALEEVGRVDQSVAATWQAHLTIGTLPILLFGTEEQKERWVHPLATGQTLGAFGLTEPNAGSDASAIETTAVRQDSEWVINGSKMFISNAGTTLSAGVTILARIALETGEDGYANFFVPTGTPGYTIGRRMRGIGWKTVDTRELYFDNCHVPQENLIGDATRGLSQFLNVLEVGRITIAALSLSLAQAVLDMSIDYASNRVQFGRPIARHQAISSKIAAIASRLEAARWLTYRAAWLRDQRRPFRKEAAMAKLRASQLAMEAATEAVQIHGGYGFMAESPVARFFLDAKVLEIGEGTNEIQHLVIAKELGC